MIQDPSRNQEHCYEDVAREDERVHLGGESYTFACQVHERVEYKYREDAPIRVVVDPHVKECDELHSHNLTVNVNLAAVLLRTEHGSLCSDQQWKDVSYYR